MYAAPPQQQHGLKYLAVIALAFWIIFGNGYAVIQSMIPILQTGAGRIVQPPVPTVQPAIARPTPPPVAPRPPAVVAPPAQPPAAPVVVPQGAPVLPAPPTVAPTAVPIVTALPQEYYTPPTPVLAANAAPVGPPACNSQNAPYRGEKDVVYGVPGVPLGHIAAWSCASQDAVVAELQQRELAMVAAYEAARK